MYDTYSFQVTFYVAYIPTTRAPGISSGLRDHVVVKSIFVEYTLLHNFEAFNVGTLFEDTGGGGWHGSRKDTSDICMVSSRSCEEDDFV